MNENENSMLGFAHYIEKKVVNPIRKPNFIAVYTILRGNQLTGISSSQKETYRKIMRTEAFRILVKSKWFKICKLQVLYIISCFFNLLILLIFQDATC